jgi:hypothetical protein
MGLGYNFFFLFLYIVFFLHVIDKSSFQGTAYMMASLSYTLQSMEVK